MQTNCPSCNAQTSTLHTICAFCKTPLRPQRTLSLEQEEELGKFIEAIEHRLKTSTNAKDGIMMGGCFGIFLLSIASWLVIYYSGLSWTLQMVLGSVIPITLFVLWGGLVTWAEGKATRSAYKTQIKGDIEHFLETRGFYRFEFDTVASTKLKTDAFLRQFLFVKD